MKTSVLCASLLFTSAVVAAEITTAENLPSPATRSGFNTGAGIGIDNGKIYDNRVAQTLTATKSGLLQKMRFVGESLRPATVPLRIDVTSWAAGQPGTILGTAYVPPAEFPTMPRLPQELNLSASFSPTAKLRAGSVYALVFRTDVAPANYRLSGGRPSAMDGVTGYPGGEVLSSQNGAPFRPGGASSDLYFQVVVKEKPPMAPWFVAAALALVVLVAQR
jgi:hypothetical protein